LFTKTKRTRLSYFIGGPGGMARDLATERLARARRAKNAARTQQAWLQKLLEWHEYPLLMQEIIDDIQRSNL